jgi:hypothetical protein
MYLFLTRLGYPGSASLRLQGQKKDILYVLIGTALQAARNGQIVLANLMNCS